MDIFIFQNVDVCTFSISKMLIMKNIVIKNIVIKNVTKLFLIKILFGNRRCFMLKRKVTHYIKNG